MSEGDNNSMQPTESMLSNELFELCKSEFLSDDGLREIITRHQLTPKSHIVSDYDDFFVEACRNKRVTGGIIRCLLEYFPAAASTARDEFDWTPLHAASNNKNVTLNIVQLLIDAAPESVHSEDVSGFMPLHRLCTNEELDETTALAILKLLVEKHPEALRHETDHEYNTGRLPIHIACEYMRQSLDFCRVLIEAYPGSERIAVEHSDDPFHQVLTRYLMLKERFRYIMHAEIIQLPQCNTCTNFTQMPSIMQQQMVIIQFTPQLGE
eukprot:scaffold6323_cov118-Skeletonema_dohrnii-CCMP3373.AAC.7